MIFKKNKLTKDKTKMTLTITKGDITDAETDAIVNAANSDLQRGGGSCGAIFDAVREAGGQDAYRKLTEACNAIGHCPTGNAVITPSFGLKAAHIIHAVGPRWSGRKADSINNPLVAPLNERELKQVDELAAAYRAVIRVCHENNIGSVTILSIGTGIYEFPEVVAAVVAKQICESEAGDLEVTLNAFSDKSLATLNAAPSVEGLALLNGHKF
jgi:O-acetyl-ADP-ribose deacetylase (regulator of RNase III)